MPDINNLFNRDNSSTTWNISGLPIHRDYENYIQQWQFLIRSYLGGAQFKKGQYLTRYVYETESEYIARLDQTPLDNHCKSVIHIYNSFLYRNNPERDFGSLTGTPEIENFLKDADMEGRTFESVMRDINIYSSIYGNCWVLVDRPETQAGTRAEELQQGIRPYLNIFTPENVLDWKYMRQPNGHYELEMIKFLEQDERPLQSVSEFYIRTWTKNEITLETFDPNKKQKVELIDSRPNMLGKVPAVCVYANRGPIRGIGVSDINDISSAQKFLFELYSEAEQLVRLTNHPTLVKTNSTQAASGAGAIITMPEELDPNLKPYILQPDGGNLSAILETIRETIKSIDRMAHMGAIRAIETRQMSGVAMQSEFLLLDAKLCEKAKQLELAEEQIFRLFSSWQGKPFDGEIKYPMAFHIRDKNLDIDILKKAADTNPADLRVKAAIDQKIMDLLSDNEEDYNEMMAHPTTTTADRSAHIQQMIMDGYTDQDILKIHPEISQADIAAAKQQLLNTTNDAAPST